MPRLATAMQQQDWRTTLTINIGNESVTGRADENFGGSFEMRGHAVMRSENRVRPV
jgi:hypothetical protein